MLAFLFTMSIVFFEYDSFQNSFTVFCNHRANQASMTMTGLKVSRESNMLYMDGASQWYAY